MVLTGSYRSKQYYIWEVPPLLTTLSHRLTRAEKKIRQKEEDKVAKGSSAALLSEEEILACRDAVAYGCIKFSDLSCTRTNDYVFSFDKMLSDQG